MSLLLPELLPLIVHKLREFLNSQMPVTVTNDTLLLRVGPGEFRVKTLTQYLVGAFKGLSLTDDSSQPIIFVAEYIPRHLGQELRQQGYYYADAMGNVWLEAGSDGTTVVYVSGQRSKKLHSEVGAAFQLRGLRLVFHLLANPALVQGTDIQLARRTGVSLSATTAALWDLAQQGFLQIGSGRRLVNQSVLAVRWAEEYGNVLRPRLPVQRYQWLKGFHGQQPWWAVASKSRLLLGGSMAARLLLQVPLASTIVTLFALTQAHPPLLQKMGLVPNPEGPVEVVKLFTVPTVLPKNYCVHPLLIYADLLLMGDEAHRSAAQQILLRYLPQLAVQEKNA